MLELWSRVAHFCPNCNRGPNSYAGLCDRCRDKALEDRLDENKFENKLKFLSRNADKNKVSSETVAR